MKGKKVSLIWRYVGLGVRPRPTELGWRGWVRGGGPGEVRPGRGQNGDPGGRGGSR